MTSEGVGAILGSYISDRYVLVTGLYIVLEETKYNMLVKGVNCTYRAAYV